MRVRRGRGKMRMAAPRRRTRAGAPQRNHRAQAPSSELLRRWSPPSTQAADAASPGREWRHTRRPRPDPLRASFCRIQGNLAELRSPRPAPTPPETSTICVGCPFFPCEYYTMNPSDCSAADTCHFPTSPATKVPPVANRSGRRRLVRSIAWRLRHEATLA